tara:strand:- start:10715 stop:11869 length:1155 start_codon:yes stop_codon:yes gene_type:complete
MNYWKKIKNSKNLLTLGSSDIIGGGVTALLWFYLASLMEAGVYGELQFMISIASTTSVLSAFVTPTVITVYTSKNYKLESTLYFITLVIGVISSIIVIVLLSRLDVGLLIMAFLFNDLAIGYILGKKKYKEYAKYLLTQKISAVILCLILFYIGGTTGVIYGLFISYLPFLIIIYKRFRETKIDFSQLKSRKEFIINNYLTSLAGLFRGQIDSIIIGIVLGYSLLGNFALSMQIYAVFMVIPNIIIRYLLPDASRGIENTNLKKLIIIFSTLLSGFGIFVTPEIVSQLLPQYIDTVLMIQIMSLGVIPSTISLILQTMSHAKEKSRYVLIGRWLSAFVMISGVFILGISYGAVGIAITFVLSSATLTVFLIASVYRKRIFNGAK